MSMVRRWRQTPELLILAFAVAIAVAASSAVALFSDRVARALSEQSGEAFGADAAIRSRDPLPEALVKRLDGMGFVRAQLVQFPSVAFKGEESTLASVKAADAGYPLRGHLRSAVEPFGEERREVRGPQAGEAWVDQRLFQDLRLKIGDELQLGRTGFRVTRLLTYEPDRGGGFSDLAPRVMIALDALPGTGLITSGSRVQYAQMLSGSASMVGALKEIEMPPGARVQTPQDGRPEIRNSLQRAQQFLDIAVLSAMLLAGAAIAASAHQHGLRLRDEAAVLKALGATSGRIARRGLTRLLGLALGAGAVGLVIGFAGQAVVALAASGLMSEPLPPVNPLAALWSLGLALLLVFGFAAPPWLAARHTPPVRVFQRDHGGRSGVVPGIVAAFTAAGLVAVHTGDVKLAGIVILGATVAALVLGAMAWVLVRSLSGLRGRGGPSRTGAAGVAIRFGLANIARRQLASVGQAVALGLALLALLLVGVVRTDLLGAWQSRLPSDAPNQFLINVQTAQVPALQAFFAARGFPDLRLWPMTRARLVELRGKTVNAESFEDPETRRWINREFNISWTDRFGDDNRLIEGTWWDPATRNEPWLSVDDYAVERLGLKLGDSLKLQIADRSVELRVYNIREVSWDSFRPNFFLVVPPGLIEGSEAQWLSSFHLRPEQKPLLRELVDAFPNVTALDLDAAMAQVRGILDRVVGAVEFIFLFTLAAGLTVLLAAIEATRADRVRETALLRALGASTRVVSLGLLAEYAALGLVAGLVAAAAAQVLGWALAAQVFDLPYAFSLRLWLAGALGGSALVSVLGWLSLRRTLSTSPTRALAASG